MKVTELTKVVVEATPDELMSFTLEQLTKTNKLSITDISYQGGKIVMHGIKDNNPTPFQISRLPFKIVPAEPKVPRNAGFISPTETPMKSYKGISEYIDLELPPGMQMPIAQFAEGFQRRYPTCNLSVSEIKYGVLNTYKHKNIIEKDTGVFYRKDAQ